MRFTKKSRYTVPWHNIRVGMRKHIRSGSEYNLDASYWVMSSAPRGNIKVLMPNNRAMVHITDFSMKLELSEANRRRASGFDQTMCLVVTTTRTAARMSLRKNGGGGTVGEDESTAMSSTRCGNEDAINARQEVRMPPCRPRSCCGKAPTISIRNFRSATSLVLPTAALLTGHVRALCPPPCSIAA